MTGIITGIQPEITRAVGTARTRAVADRALANRAASGGAASAEGSAPQGARVVTVTAALGAIAGALVLVSSPLWAGQQIPHSAAVGVTVMAVGVFLYALQATMSGVTAGEDRWYLFAAVGGLESAGRLILMLAAALMIPSLAGLEVATVVPMGLWLILALVTVSGRRLWVARADVPARRLTTNILWSFLSSARGGADDGLPQRAESERCRGERTGRAGHPDPGDFHYPFADYDSPAGVPGCGGFCFLEAAPPPRSGVH